MIFTNFPSVAQVKEDEWAAIPEVGDWRNKKLRNPRGELLTPVPDTLIAQRLLDLGMSSSVDSRVQKAGTATGLQTPNPLSIKLFKFIILYYIQNA